MRINTLNISSGPGFHRGLSHLAGSVLQPVGEIQNGLATARQAVLEVLLADRPAGVTIGAAQVVAGAARIVLAILLPFRGQLFRGAEGGRQLAHLAEVVAVGLGEAQQDALGHPMHDVVGHDVAYGFAQLGDDVSLGPLRRVFLPEGLAPAFPLATLLLRLGLLLGADGIRLQDGLVQGLAAGLILAKLRIGVPVDDGAVRLGDAMGGDPLAVRPPVLPFRGGDEQLRPAVALTGADDRVDPAVADDEAAQIFRAVLGNGGGKDGVHEVAPLLCPARPMARPGGMDYNIDRCSPAEAGLAYQASSLSRTHMAA